MLNALNVRNQTPLMIAVLTGEEDIVRTMVDFIGDEVHTARYFCVTASSNVVYPIGAWGYIG